MSLTVTPLATGILMALGASSLPSAGFDTVTGLMVNWAANGIQGDAVGLMKRVTDNTIDPESGLPRNHDLQRASCDALHGAATALLLEAAGRLQPRKPWIPALADFLRQGRWGKEPLLNALDRPDLAEMAELRRAITSERFKLWHDTLSLNETELRSCFRGGRCSLAGVLPHRFEAWLLKQGKENVLHQAVLSPLRDGWSPGGAGPLLRFEEIYCLFLRESLKQRPEVFRIIMADTQMSLEQAVAGIEDSMNAHVDMTHSLLEGQDELLMEMRGGQLEMRESLQDTTTVLGLLQCEVRAGNLSAAESLSVVKTDIQRLNDAFMQMQRQVFGLTLLRPEATLPPPSFGDQGDLWLIQAKYRALKLACRDDIVESLWKWLHSPAAISVRLLVGDAGAGKTRLGMELVWRLAAEKGEDWHAGFISSSDLRQLAEHANPARLQWHKPTLVVVDYARAATDGLKALLKELARRVDEKSPLKLRLLLLERTASATKDWVDDLMAVESSHGGRPAKELFDPKSAEPLPPLDMKEGRHNLFKQSLQLLAARSGNPPLHVPSVGEMPAFDAMLQKNEWRDPLVPVMYALVANRTKSVMHALNLSRADLALRVAGFETERLTRFASTTDDSAPQRLFLHVAALATLCGGFSADEALRVAKRESVATDWTWQNGPRDLVHKLRNAWPGPDSSIAELKPDVVAEAFVLMHLADSRRFSLTEQQQTILRASNDHERNVAGLVLRAFHNFQLDPQLGPTLGEWTLALVEHGLSHREPALIAAIDDAMPERSVMLEHYAIKVTRTRYELLPAWNLDNLPAGAKRASVARRLGRCALRYGTYEEALERSEEAVAICRDLVHRDPDTYEADLARSLNGVSICYGRFDRDVEALERSKEAVAICRKLVQRDPDANLPNLAESLNVLAIRFGELKQHDQGLEIVKETVAIYRELRLQNPDAYLAPLAESLLHLCAHYIELRRIDEALKLSEETATICRELRSRNPDAYLSHLAMSLNALSYVSDDLGRREDALVLNKETVAIFREIKLRNPNSNSYELACSLRDLSSRFDDLNRHDEARDVCKEAVAICRELAQLNPEKHLADLAISLRELAIQHAKLSRHDEALEVYKESAERYRELVQRNPDTYQAELNVSLNGLSLCFGHLGRHGEALEVSIEAVAICRELVQRNLHANLSHLAFTLQLLASSHANLGWYERALDAQEESVARYRELAQRSPEDHLGFLAHSLTCLSFCYGKLDRHDEAAELEKEAHELRTGAI